MPTLRRATPADASLITSHRHLMFAANNFATDLHLKQMDTHFEPWLRPRLADGRYIGLLLEGDRAQPPHPRHEPRVLASAGIYFLDFPPHWMHFESERAYLLNFYTAPQGRGHGYARQLLQACLDICRERGSTVVTLHASPFGRPLYEQFGFTASTEMLLRLP